MADSIFYTTQAHDKMFVKSVTNTATGTDKHNMLDHNLDTIWSPSDYSNYKAIVVDLGSSGITVDAMGLWIANYDTDFSSARFQMEGSDNDSDYFNIQLWFFTANAALNIGDYAAGLTWRYYKCTFIDLPEAPEVAHIFFFRKRTISRGPGIPADELDIYANREARLFGNRRIIKVEAQKEVQDIERSYQLITGTEKDTAHTIFQEMGGSRRLFVLKENSDQYLCRLTHNKELRTHIAHERYEMSFHMQTLTYIADGESY